MCSDAGMSTSTRRTRASRHTAVEPRLPHERDETVDAVSGDAASAGSAAPTPRGRQAHEDVQQGLTDTDRGPVLDRLYNEKVAPKARRRRAP
jgi:hypothetical protein